MSWKLSFNLCLTTPRYKLQPGSAWCLMELSSPIFADVSHSSNSLFPGIWSTVLQSQHCLLVTKTTNWFITFSNCSSHFSNIQIATQLFPAKLAPTKQKLNRLRSADIKWLETGLIEWRIVVGREWQAAPDGALCHVISAKRDGNRNT